MRLTVTIITVVLSVPAFGACAVVQSPVGPSVDTPSREVVVDTPTQPVAIGAPSADPVCDGGADYDRETDLCGPSTPPTPTTFPVSQDCLNDDLGMFNPETDLCELP